MFEWLDRELAEIRTRRFHVVDGPAAPDFREAVQNSDLPVPPSYVEFVLRFGNARLYRMTRLDGHWLYVCASPREAVSRGGIPLLCVGTFNDSDVFFRDDTLTLGAEAAVYESTNGGIRKVAASFEAWLTGRAAWARRRYSRQEWARVQAGPPPFTAEELSVIEARRLFRWRVIGVNPNGEIMYEVTNGSDRRLPFLSVGIRKKTGTFGGGVWLSVGHIAPGETVVVVRETYRNLIDPENVEAYALPDPEPEERARYWEFRE